MTCFKRARHQARTVLPILRYVGFALLLCLCGFVAPPGKPETWGEWKTWGDQGDGTYRNPVIPADYSDLDAIRVGADYYAISSTMQFSPGMVILHSKDMVNWTILGHAVSDLTQVGIEMTWAKMERYGRGIWAGAIRYHARRFWVYFGTPDEGYFMTTATDPAGPWAPLHRVLEGGGWDDPCPFWDDDGQGYLVGTNFHDGYKIHLWKLTPDGRDLVADSDRVIHQSKGSEANKLYKFGDLYYHLFSEVDAEGRVVMMERSKNILGPYSEIRQLSHADRQVMQPNQGGLLQSGESTWWLTHHGTGSWEGRCISLVPVTWIDGWPILGEPDEKGIGHFLWSGDIPVKGTHILTPQRDDDFSAARLAPQWEWNHQPRAEKWSLTERNGWLRLHAFRPHAEGGLTEAGNTLTQRVFRTTYNEAIAKLDLSNMEDGQSAGLCHFAKDDSSLGVRQDGKTRRIEFQVSGRITAGPILTGAVVWLRSTWGLDGRSEYSYSLDGRNFSGFGVPYQLTWGHYRGDRIGLYSYNTKADSGYADFDYFHYSLKSSVNKTPR